MSKPARAAGQIVAAIAVSARGAALACRLATAMPDVTAHLPARFAPGTGGEPYDQPVRLLLESLFGSVSGLVLVMATGAAVRLIAPLLRDKWTDPAVVVVDDAGRFAISLVSGHIGGANRLAERVAAALDALPVITTASESAGVPPVDLLGREEGWRIEPDSALTTVAAALVNGERAGVFQDTGSESWLATLPASVTRFSEVDALVAADPAAAIIVSDHVFALPDRLVAKTATYRPPSLVLGIGCSRGASDAEIAALVDGTLAAHRLSPLSVCALASIDRKADEPGLLAFCARRQLKLVTYPAAELDMVQGEWKPSEVVRSAVGTGGVAEPAALACAGVSRLLVKKVKSRQVTLAIARRYLTPSPLRCGEGLRTERDGANRSTAL